MASNSPLAGKVQLGEHILKVNGHPVVRPEDMVNIIMMSSENVNVMV